MKIRNNLQRIVLLAGAALLSTGAMTAPAAERIVTEAEIVKYSMVEAATPGGARSLYGKLQWAAMRVCSSSVPATRIPHVDPECAATALSKAVVDVGNPLIIALHSDKQAGSKMAAELPLQPAMPETVASR